MDIESVAAALDGREYREEVRPGEEAAWKAAGIVVAYGASDDLLELRGAICEELDAGSVLLHCGGVLDEDTRAEYGRGGWERARKRAAMVTADWCPPVPDLRWSVRITRADGGEVPSARFQIQEDGRPFCRGVVFRLDDLSTLPGEES